MASSVKGSCSATPTVFKRFVHRSPSYQYLKRNANYLRLMDRARSDSFQSPGANMKKCPGLVHRILKVESAMVQRGYVPFVHAVPASAKVPFALYRAVQGKKENFQPLRSPLDRTIPCLEESWKKVPQDEDRIQKPHLISASYALTSNTEPLESATSWGFRNHCGNEQSKPMIEILSSFFEEAERTFGRPIPSSFKDRGIHLILEYNRLKVGSFLVFGVPRNRLSRWMYNSKPYNVPTGCSIEEVVDNPERAVDGTIATLVVSQEILDPDSGLVVVEANDKAQVEKFCEGMTFSDPMKFGEYRKILGSPNPFEEEKQRKALDDKLWTFSSDFLSWMNRGEEPSFEETFQSSPWDFPALLP